MPGWSHESDSLQRLASRTQNASSPLLRSIGDADVCIVPGDIDLGDRAIDLLAAHVAPRMPVIYVPGNHCYRGSNHDEIRQAMREKAHLHPNMHLLDPGTVVIEDVRFVGATLWTDFGYSDFRVESPLMSSTMPRT